MRRGGRGPGIGVMLLAMQLFQVGFDRIPPVTLATIGAQVVIFLRLLNVAWPSIGQVCISPVNVYYREEWKRLLMASFFHLDDMHLYFNMVSFLWKGLTLERRLGSGYFLYMIAVFSVLSNIVCVGLSMGLEHGLKDPSYLTQCAAGFSGVLFALKVVTTHMLPPGIQYVMGMIPVPSRIACWVELALIQVLVPNASFVGHLAGIIVGLLYVKGPLKPLMNMFVPVAPSYTYRSGTTGGQTWGTGTSGYRQSRGGDYSRYTGGLSEEEQMAQAMRESRQQYFSPSRPMASPSAPPVEHHENHADMPFNPGSAPSETYYSPQGRGASTPYPTTNTFPQGPANVEEMRRRRLAHFQNS